MTTEPERTDRASSRRGASLLFGLGGLLLALAGCGGGATEAGQGDYWQGYVEGDNVFAASSQGGSLVRIAVEKGQAVKSGELLFELDPEPQALQVEQARERVAQAEARLADLERGVRPSELAAIEARLAGAKSALGRARADLERRRELFESSGPDVVSKEEIDRFAAEVEVDAFNVASLEAELETARLGGRSGAVEAARREVATLRIAQREAQWALDQKRVTAPTAALVQDTLFDVGEVVPAGRPVVSLLPPGGVLVRFFVPQSALPTLAAGDSVQVRVDGLEGEFQARIRFITTEAEFTPPVIYSRESRSKLVFMVEATPEPDALARLHPGQPLEVRPGAR
ncbi:HlyD family secretion protein [Engelhardtia mirabilis]|uniref:Multidrug resistance protein MdtN n=1 Tax=Engelhardtia mirabilis TaxID=2528011 RepID=A0A518BM42_9BACT|nr:Multidrug resistance protein MdtN [Planctomycetes bacterium Pla133]QDV02368.1 Multidrug resistance protein MdtN [Planctomycetes bacterium Pla86]